MERLLNLFILGIYLESSIFILSLLHLSGYLLTVALKKKKKRYFGLSFLLLLLAPVVSLSLFRVPIGRASVVYISGSIIVISAIIELRKHYPVKTNWMRISTILSFIAVIGFPLIFFWYGNVATPKTITATTALSTTSRDINTKLSETANIIQKTSEKSPITTLPKDIEDALKPLSPSYVIVSSTNHSIIYSTKGSEIKGDASVWFPWTTDIAKNQSRQGITTLPNSTPLAAVAYQLPDSYVGAKMVVVAYRLTPIYFDINPTSLKTIGFGTINGILWTSNGPAQQKTILDSADLNTYMKKHLPTEASSTAVESSTGLYTILTEPLPSLDDQPYYLLSISEL